MTAYTQLLGDLAQPNGRKIVLLVLDGVGGIHTADAPRTALEAAATPNLDRLAEQSALGRTIPVDVGVTPGSGPGHLALFGYDPSLERHRIGRGVLEALGINCDLAEGEIAARGNFCTLDAGGLITDRRAGRPSDEECHRLSGMLDAAIGSIGDATVRVLPVKEHRFCVTFRGEGLDPRLGDTDPQVTGKPPLPPRARVDSPQTAQTVQLVEAFIQRARKILKDEPLANGLTLRGFSTHPGLPTFQELYGLDPAAVAAYPLYRGVASLAGMKVLETGATPADEFATVAEHWDAHDFFFVHIKKTDSAGEDGDLDAKVEVIEQVDRALESLLALEPAVLAITGDHATPHVMKAHSWHPVPLLMRGPFCDVDQTTRFTESEALLGSIGAIPADRLMGLLLANAGKLAKFGA